MIIRSDHDNRHTGKTARAELPACRNRTARDDGERSVVAVRWRSDARGHAPDGARCNDGSECRWAPALAAHETFDLSG